MNKNLTTDNKNITISAKYVEAKDAGFFFDEDILKIQWEEYSCGVVITMESYKIYVFASDVYMQRCISRIWDLWEAEDVIREAGLSEGADGLIERCIDFVREFAMEYRAKEAEMERNA